ncbi:hypothetical protein Tco_1539115 [Tanacetum coccineum]
MEIEERRINEISALTTQVGLSDEEKKACLFLDSLDEVHLKSCKTANISRGSMLFPTQIVGDGHSIQEGSTQEGRECGAENPYSSEDATKDSLGEALGSSKTHTARRESWWLCEEVQSKVAKKQARFIELLSCQEGNLEELLRRIDDTHYLSENVKKP